MTIDTQTFSAETRRGRRLTRSGKFSLFYSLALGAFLILVIEESPRALFESPIETILCLFVGGLSIYGQLLSLERQAAIHFTSFVFCFLFMSAAPILQIGAYIDPVFRIDHWALLAALNGLAFTTIGIVATMRMKKLDPNSRPTASIAPGNVNFSLVFLLTMTVSILAIILFRESLFTNRDEFGRAADELFADPIVSSMARTLLLSMPFFGAVIGLRAAIGHRKLVWMWLFSLATLITAIPNNPVVNARYQIAGLIFFWIDYFFYGRKTKFLAAMLVVGVLVAPSLQVFRHDDTAVHDSDSSELFGTTLLSKDYDAFLMSCYTMLTVDVSGVGWGSNLLGAALFFVPRALWIDKPEPTAWIVYDIAAHTTNLGTSNLSTPLMAEGYFAFGWTGALLIALCYWWGVTKIMLLSRRNPDSWAFLFRCVCTGLALIFLRGTLTVGVSSLAGTFVAAAIPALLLRFGNTGRGRQGLRFGRRLVVRLPAIARNSRQF